MSGPAHAPDHPTPDNPRFDELPLEKRQKLLSEFAKRLNARLAATPPPRPTRSDITIIVGAHVLLLTLSYISDGEWQFQPSEARLLLGLGILSAALLISRPLLLLWKRKNLLSQIREIEDQRERA